MSASRTRKASPTCARSSANADSSSCSRVCQLLRCHHSAQLSALAGGERYGYELVKSLTRIQGLGTTEGTLYPLLSRLRVQGLVTTRLVESAEGPARKYYALTPAGREARDRMNEHFDLIGKRNPLIP